MLTRVPLVLTQWLAVLPLGCLRSLGWVMGALLYVAVASRRRVVATNLRLCFPAWSAAQRRAQTFLCFVYFAQAWLDRGWLWHAAPDVTLKRIKLVGAVHELDGNAPTLIFTPHFVGMDAGWVALTQQVPRQFMTIYARQTNAAVDDWILKGRSVSAPDAPMTAKRASSRSWPDCEQESLCVCCRT